MNSINFIKTICKTEDIIIGFSDWRVKRSRNVDHQFKGLIYNRSMNVTSKAFYYT